LATSGLPLQITDAVGETGDCEQVSHEQCSGQGYEIELLQATSTPAE
jgi:hypothetical protein